MKNLALSTSRQRREQIGSIEFGTEEKLRASKISEMYVAIRLRRVGAVSDELVPFLVRLRCDTQCERRAPGTHIHLMARDPDGHKRLWVGVLDAEVTHSGSLKLLKIPFAS